MSFKFNHVSPSILDGLLTKYKRPTDTALYAFESISFKHIQKLLLEHIDVLVNCENVKLLDRIDCFVYKNEDDFNQIEVNNSSNIDAKELAKRMLIAQDNLKELRDLGCSVLQINNFINEVIKLSFYGNRYILKADVSDITHKLTITIEEKHNCNNSYEIERESLLKDKNLADYKDQIIDFEKKIGFQQTGVEDNKTKETIQIEVAEMNIEDCFTMKTILDKVLTTRSVFDDEIVDFLSQKATINGKPFNVNDDKFLKFLQGRLILLYHIVWQIVRFAYCFNKKKNQFLPTIL